MLLPRQVHWYDITCVWFHAVQYACIQDVQPIKHAGMRSMHLKTQELSLLGFHASLPRVSAYILRGRLAALYLCMTGESCLIYYVGTVLADTYKESMTG